tara:strand:- start:21 stop:221 length:201 start_codon:yes stop_codon:yes gene_type:complete
MTSRDAAKQIMKSTLEFLEDEGLLAVDFEQRAQKWKFKEQFQSIPLNTINKLIVEIVDEVDSDYRA